MDNGHYINDVTFYSFNLKESLARHSLPMWTPYYYSGRPLFAQPEYHFIDFNFLLILLTGNIYLAMNYSAIIYLFLAGLGMYLLAGYLAKNKKAGFISALIYMFNGFMHTFVVPGNIMVIEGYSLVPFIFLFAIKALKSRELIFNSVIAGMFVGMLIFVGGVILLPYIFLLISLYYIIYLVGDAPKKRLLNLVIAGFVILLVAGGISAIKLLPDLEFMKLSNRGGGVPYQEYLGKPIKINNFMFTFVSNVFFSGEQSTAAIGVAGFVLLLLGLYNIKNRIVSFSILAIVLSLLISSGSFLTEILYKVPVFNQTRHAERTIFLYVFAGSILAGVGYLNLQLFAEKYKKLWSKIFFLMAVALISIELIFMQSFPSSVDIVKPHEIPILDYMSKDQTYFRTINLALSTLIGASGYNYYSQLGISELKGGSGIWFNDYLEYLIVGENSRAKFWGVLNNKYVIMGENKSIEGLKYIGKFEECKKCPIREAWGPYLYMNQEFIPRYYIAPNSILVSGDEKPVREVIYGLMLNNLWSPENIVIISGGKIGGYDIGFLNKFDYLIIVSYPDAKGIERLKEYIAGGGRIVPDIFNNKNTISAEDLNLMLNNPSVKINEMKVDEYTNNKVIINLNGERGWLVASERFAHFPGWKAGIKGNDVRLLKANNAITALYLDGEKGKLIFEYKPDSYRKGRFISIISFIIVLAYLAYFMLKKKARPHHQS